MSRGPAAPAWVLSCEHAGHRVPPAYRSLFAGHGALLRSHRGWDAGAAGLARALARALEIPALLHLDTRLLVDPNRSPGHRACFSELTRGLPPAARGRLLERHHRPHRERVRVAVRDAIARAGACVHVGVHTFTPRLRGVERTAELGLLYDPARRWERELCARWREILVGTPPGGALRGGRWRVRRNYPYRGVGDGLTTTLRGEFGSATYAGIELEVNQGPLSTPAGAAAVARALAMACPALRAAATATRSGGGPPSRGRRGERPARETA